MISVEEAQARALAVAPARTVERVGLREAYGRVLAEEVRARADVPPHDNSAMDGFAVRSDDVTAGKLDLVVAAEVAAGHVAARAVGAGEAFKIMTGAPMPAGADAVVMVEKTESAGGRVRLLEPVRAGENVRRAGEDLRAGSSVLAPGVRLGAAELGVLASVQHASVLVARRPEVAILVTGDELRDLHQPLDAGAIADTNSYALDGLVRDAGGQPRVLPIVRDDPTLLRQAIEAARTADLIVSSGGVSVGEHDHVKPVLAELGAQLDFWRVDMKPGKPVAVARLGATPYYGLPGNPVSTMIAFLLFVRPAIRAALGAEPALDLPRAEAQLARPLRSRSDRRSFLRARASFDAGVLRAAPVEKQGSHVLTSMIGANALIVLPPGTHDLAAGAPVSLLLIGPPT